MKIVGNILLIFLAVILQISLIPKISIFFALPNLLFLVMLMLIFVDRFDEALLWAGVGGILLDLLSPVRFGVYLFSLLIIYLIVLMIVKKIFTNPNLVVALGFFLLGSMVFDLIWLFINPQWQIILGNAIYNTVVGVILYWLVREYLKPREAIKI